MGEHLRKGGNHGEGAEEEETDGHKKQANLQPIAGLFSHVSKSQ